MEKNILRKDGLYKEIMTPEGKKSIGEITEIIEQKEEQKIENNYSNEGDKNKENIPIEENKKEKLKTKKQRNKEIKEFNKNPNTKEYGVKLISKRNYLMAIVIIFLLLALLTIGMIWKNNTLEKIAEKDFGTNVNVEPTYVNMTDADQTQNYFNHTIIVQPNITIEVVGNFSINPINES